MAHTVHSIDWDLYERMITVLRGQRTRDDFLMMQILKAVEELGEMASSYLISSERNPRKRPTSTSLAEFQSEITDTIGTLFVLLTCTTSDPGEEIERMQKKFAARLTNYYLTELGKEE